MILGMPVTESTCRSAYAGIFVRVAVSSVAAANTSAATTMNTGGIAN